MIEHICSCGKRYKIQKEAQGKTLICPSCKATFSVPVEEKKISHVQKEIETYLKANIPFLYIITNEEVRAENVLKRAAQNVNKEIFFWSVTKGFYDQPQKEIGLKLVYQALDNIIRVFANEIIVLRDFHPFFRNEIDGAIVTIRKMKDCIIAAREKKLTIIILSSVIQLPPELENYATVIELPTPCYLEIKEILQKKLVDIEADTYRIKEMKRRGEVILGVEPVQVDVDKHVIDKFARAFQGLTEDEIKNVLEKCIAKDGVLDANDLSIILLEKGKLVRRLGILEFYPPKETISDVGGMHLLKQWLEKKKNAFSFAAQSFGVDTPKGILLLGVPGCGKSLVAKAVSSFFQMPLLRFDIGKVFSMYIGSTEENMRRALKMAESLAPSILWIDELEKAFSGIQSSGVSDAGVTARTFGLFLTWLQEKDEPVFVIATANDVSQLPPEFLRKGRLDEIFFVDLPNTEERKSIFAIHLAKRKKDPRSYDLHKLSLLTENFSGADIEAVVKEAIESAFSQSRDLSMSDLVSAIKNTVPIYTTMREKIEAIRQWKGKRARPVS